jgi:hypothetical protein
VSRSMPDTWSADQVRALAPDVASRQAAARLAVPAPWSGTGHSGAEPPVLWGLCAGSGKSPYQASVDLSEPAYKCSCPSRKFPCKHALALLLLWSGGQVERGAAPPWVDEWLAGRAQRVQRAEARRESAGVPADPGAAERRAAQRADRIAAGLDELDRWLADQVRHGLAGAETAGYRHWDGTAARLVDAQAPGAAAAVKRLGGTVGSGAGWAGRLLSELALLRLLTAGYQRLDTLPAELADTVRSRVGLTVPQEQVLATAPVRDRWLVLGLRDEQEDRLTVRRAWLRGLATGRPALVLSFAAPNQPLAADFVPGTTIDADLHFYPGTQPLRALPGTRHTAPTRVTGGGAPSTSDGTESGPAGGGGPGVLVRAADDISTALEGYARALTSEPWLDAWPVLLASVTPVRHGDRWHLAQPDGTALPLHPAVSEPWPLVAACGGAPATVAAEWTPRGLRPLTAWPGDRLVLL